METKFCPRCTRTLPRSDFYRKSGKQVQAYCKPCFNSYCVERWVRLKKEMIEHMGGKCEDCEGSFHYAVFEFHHLEEKDYEWTKLRLLKRETILQELKKCILLCANCHRLRHAEA